MWSQMTRLIESSDKMFKHFLQSHRILNNDVTKQGKCCIFRSKQVLHRLRSLLFCSFWWEKGENEETGCGGQVSRDIRSYPNLNNKTIRKWQPCAHFHLATLLRTEAIKEGLKLSFQSSQRKLDKNLFGTTRKGRCWLPEWSSDPHPDHNGEQK